jgi:hypothetical protein
MAPSGEVDGEVSQGNRLLRILRILWMERAIYACTVMMDDGLQSWGLMTAPLWMLGAANHGPGVPGRPSATRKAGRPQ